MEARKGSGLRKTKPRMANTPESLQELCSRVVGQTHPFELVQQHHPRVPEELQKRIAFWSFPLNEKQVLDHASVMMGMTDSELARSSSTEIVSEMFQTGMYLSAEVPQGGNKVFIQFDRGCISACGCTCKFSGWCSHILALILARMRRANTTALVVHPPLSETFSQFNRDQLQKLLQYLVEGHPLELVPVAQAISSELQDVSSELNNLPGAPDVTGGGSSDEEAMWCTNRREVLRNLESTFESCFQHLSYLSYDFDQITEDDLMDFQQFKKRTLLKRRVDTPSVFTYILQCHGSNMAYVPKWALCQLIQLCKAKPDDRYGRSKEWTAWCFCRMIAPVLRIFLADPAVSTPAKEEVCRSLAAACSDAVPFFEPVAAVLGSLLSVAETPLRATPRQFHSTLTELQQCIAHPTGDSASLLHRLLAMLQYFSFHQKLTSPEMAHNICMALFPASVSSSASIEELSTPAVKGLPLELILEYGSLLLDCLIQTDATISCLIDISIKLLGSFACLEGNEGLCVYHNWAGKKILQLLKNTEEQLSREAKKLLMSEALKLSRMVQAHLAHSKSSAVVKPWCWNLMQFICFATKNGQKALAVLNESVTEDVIGLLGSTILDRVQAETLRNSILPVMVSLFSSLLPDAAQKLFVALSKAYPQPLAWVESERLHKSDHDRVYQYTDGAPQPKSRMSVFPHLADLEASSTTIEVDTEKLGLRWRKLHSVVLEPHINFLRDVAELVHARPDKALISFQLALLHTQANNCKCSEYKFKYGEGFHYPKRKHLFERSVTRDRILLEDADRVVAIRYLQNVWQYTLKPNEAIKVAAQLMPESGTCKDICDFVLPLIDHLTECADLKVALGVLSQGTPEQLIDGVRRLLESSQLANNMECLCQFLESTGSMYNMTMENTTESLWLHLLQDLATMIVDRMTSQEDPHNHAYSSLNMKLVAHVICDAGSDTVLHVASLLQQRSNLSSFPDQVMTLCAQFYHIPTSSVSKDLLLQPPFQNFLEPVYESKKTVAQSVISGDPHNASMVDHTLRQFHNFTTQMGMEEEFVAFATEMAKLCPFNVSRMIEKRFLNIPRWR